MKVSELTIEVNAKVVVDKSTADACLKLVELYVNQTGTNVCATKRDDGTLNFMFLDDEESENDRENSNRKS